MNYFHVRLFEVLTHSYPVEVEPYIHVILYSIASTVKGDIPCRDYSNECEQWSRNGECRSNSVFMYAFCRFTCRECSDAGKSTSTLEVKDE